MSLNINGVPFISDIQTNDKGLLSYIWSIIFYCYQGKNTIMIFVLKKSKYIFIAIISLFLEGCLMHSFDENGDFPLQLDVKTVMENKRVTFEVKESHIELKDYYLKNININTSNIICDEKYKKGLVIWSYKPNLPQEKISVLSKISYKGEKSTLKKNTLYTVTIEIQKVKDNKIGRGGVGRGIFVLKDNGDILYGYNYGDINKLCREY